MNNQYTEKEKEVLISQWEKSGQSQTAWCKAEGFNRRTFGNWVKKHKSRISEPSGETSFIPLELDNTSVPSFKLHYPGGVCLECPSNISTEQLIALLRLSQSV